MVKKNRMLQEVYGTTDAAEILIIRKANSKKFTSNLIRSIFIILSLILLLNTVISWFVILHEFKPLVLLNSFLGVALFVVINILVCQLFSIYILKQLK